MISVTWCTRTVWLNTHTHTLNSLADSLISNTKYTSVTPQSILKYSTLHKATHYTTPEHVSLACLQQSTYRIYTIISLRRPIRESAEISLRTSDKAGRWGVKSKTGIHCTVTNSVHKLLNRNCPATNRAQAEHIQFPVSCVWQRTVRFLVIDGVVKCWLLSNLNTFTGIASWPCM